VLSSPLEKSVLRGCSDFRDWILQGRLISTVAGNGIPGYAGDGGLSTQAKLNYPRALAIDAADNLYIADTQNNAIRKINAVTGVITTVAGTGEAGDDGDGHAAISSKLNHPRGVGVDALGHVYISDTENNIVRKVHAVSGLLTTVAGTGTLGYSGQYGLATEMLLFYPSGLKIDVAGNLYIADSGNNRIRKVNALSGFMVDIAGTTLSGYSGDGSSSVFAQLNQPEGLAFDANNNLYIADTGNGVVRRFMVDPYSPY
ncbi:hypothetical protein ACFIQG_21775, partial [Comamonas odontotermitis]